MASILPMVRALLPVTPSRRIAAGHAARTFQGPHAGTHDLIGKPEKPLFRIMRNNAREDRARELYSTTNVVLFEQRLVTRLVLPLDVIEQ